jgi:hypothetical protein
MWLSTIYGFFSVVNAKESGGKGVVDPDLLMIRARRKEHLEALKARFKDRLGGSPILETPLSDYHWRLICPKTIWAECLKEMALEQTYPNFKNECAHRFGYHNIYLHALHKVWGVMAGIQEK